MADIDRLELSVEARATKANRALDTLVTKLGSVSTALSRVNSSGLTGLSNGINKFANASLNLSNVKTNDFTRMIKNINALSSINTSRLYSASSAINSISRSLSAMTSVGKNAQKISELASNINTLGQKKAITAADNIPKIATSLSALLETLSKAPKVSNNVINLTNAIANLTSQGSKVGTSSRGIARALGTFSSASETATRKSFSLSSAIGKIYQSYFMVFRMIKKLGSSVVSSMNYIEEYNYFNVTMGKIGKEWQKEYSKYGYDNAEAYAESFESRMNSLTSKMTGYNVNFDGTLSDSGLGNLGLDVTSMMNYEAGISQVTNSLKLTGEASLATSKALTMLAGDMSSFRNVELSTVMNNLQSGLIGQSRALYKYGIDITNATLATYAYKYGVSQTVSEMTQGEKMQLRVLDILDQSKVAWGDLANTINSPSNQLRLLNNNIKATSRTIGNILLPTVAKVLPYVNGLAIAIRRLFEWCGKMLGIDMSAVIGDSGTGYSDIFDGIEDGADDTSDSLDKATSSAKELKNELMGFDEINKLSDTSNSSSGSSGSGGSSGGLDLTDKINAALADYEKVWNSAFDSMNNKAEGFANSISKFWKKIYDRTEPLRSSILNLWDAFKPFAENVGIGLVNFLKDAGNYAIKFGNTKVATYLNKIAEALKNIDPKKAQDIGYGLGIIITSLMAFKTISGVSSKISAVERSIGAFFKVVGPLKYVAIAAGVIGVVAALEKFGFIKVNWEPLKRCVDKLFESIEKMAKKIDWKKLTKCISNLIEVLFKVTANIGEGLIDFFSTFVSIGAGTINAIVLVLDKFFKLIDKIPAVNIKALSGALSALLIELLAYNKYVAISKSVKEAIKGLKEAINSFVLALEAHPYVAIAAGIATVVGALVTLANSYSKDEVDEYTESMKKLTNEMRERYNVTSELALSISKYVDEAGAGEIGYAEDLADRYYELANKEQLTNDEKDRMKQYAKELCEIIPDLSQYIDEETGQLKIQKETVEALISAKKEQYKLEAAKEKIVDAYKQQIDNEEAYKEAIDKNAEARQKLRDKEGEYIQAQIDFDNWKKSHPDASLTEKDKEAQKISTLAHEVENLKNAYTQSDLALDVAKKSLETSTKTIDRLNDTISDTQTTIDKVQFTKLSIKAAKAIDEMGGIWQDGKQILGQKAIEIQEAIEDGLTPDENGYYDLGNGIVVAYGNGIGKGKNEIVNTIDETFINQLNNELPKGYQISYDNGQLVVDTYAETVENGQEKIKSAVDRTFLNEKDNQETIEKIKVNSSGWAAWSIDSWKNKLDEAKGNLKTHIQNLGANYIETPFGDVMSNLPGRAKESVNAIVNSFNTNTNAGETFGNNIGNNVGNGINNTLGSFKNTIFDTIGNLFSGTKIEAENVQKVMTGLGSLPTIALKVVRGYATGGFPEDGWFRASRGELMGKFDNGQSVVANNQQITDGISAAVYKGNQETNILLRELIDSVNNSSGDTDIVIDGKTVFKVVKKEADNYTKQTGKEPFPT